MCSGGFNEYKGKKPDVLIVVINKMPFLDNNDSAFFNIVFGSVKCSIVPIIKIKSKDMKFVTFAVLVNSASCYPHPAYQSEVYQSNKEHHETI